ncbi:MAG: iron-containing redox enzyme family protein [Alphaproteobacteria bacterium]|nr:iron-containing redox enzyme family protein [Alphaproteobacteria bacterium]
MALDIDGTLARIDAIHERRDFVQRPLWKGLLEGTHSLAMVREMARQLSIIPLHNHNYHGRLYVICPDPAWRERIAEVVYEEGTGRLFSDGVAHNELYFRFGEGVGVDREEMRATRYCAGALAFKQYFIQACSGDFIDGVAAHMLGAEAQGPGHYRQIADKLQEKFGLSDAEVAFWVIHDLADEDHSNIGRELLEQFASSEDDLERVVRVVDEMQRMMELLDHSIWECMRRADEGGRVAAA